MENDNFLVGNIQLDLTEKRNVFFVVVIFVTVGIILNIIHLGVKLCSGEKREVPVLCHGSLILLMLILVLPLDITVLENSHSSSVFIICYVKEIIERILFGLHPMLCNLRTIWNGRDSSNMKCTYFWKRRHVPFIVIMLLSIVSCLIELFSYLKAYSHFAMKSFEQLSFCPVVDSMIPYKSVGIFFVDILPFVLHVIKFRSSRIDSLTPESEGRHHSQERISSWNVIIITWIPYIFFKCLMMVYTVKFICICLLFSKLFVCLIYAVERVIKSFQTCGMSTNNQFVNNSDLETRNALPMESMDIEDIAPGGRCGISFEDDNFTNMQQTGHLRSFGRRISNFVQIPGRKSSYHSQSEPKNKKIERRSLPVIKFKQS